MISKPRNFQQNNQEDLHMNTQVMQQEKSFYMPMALIVYKNNIL